MPSRASSSHPSRASSCSDWVEGFSSSREFIEVWNELHRRKKFIDDQERMVYTYFYVPSIDHLKRRVYNA
jgi:hypothetical protein